MTLPCPASVKGYHVVVPVVHVNACRIYLCQIKRCLTGICHLHASCDGIIVMKYRVEQLHLHSNIGIAADDF